MSDKLDDLAKFLQGHMDRMHAHRASMIECSAVWLPYKVNGSKRLPVDSNIALSEDDKIVNASYATHKIIAIYSTIGSERIELILTDVLSQEPKVITI